MNTSFIASNGIKIETSSTLEHTRLFKRGYNRLDSYDFLNFGDMSALREFFLHERDQAKGWWRDPEAPDNYVFISEHKGINVVNERTSRWTPLTRAIVKRYPTLTPEYETAARYYEAHPEALPWHSATEGEAWELTCPKLSNSPGVYIWRDGFFRGGPTAALKATDENIVSARKIYPTS